MSDPTHYIKFHGSFRDLVPKGWTFKKLFSSKLRCYVKSFQLGTEITIFQKGGGFVEVDDFKSYSYLLYNLIKSGSLPKLAPTSNSHKFMVNLESLDVELWDYLKHEQPLNDLVTNKRISVTERTAQIQAYHRKYRTIYLPLDALNCFEELVNSGTVSITPHV